MRCIGLFQRGDLVGGQFQVDGGNGVVDVGRLGRLAPTIGAETNGLGEQAAGRDVIVPQFLGRTDFIEQLAGVADRSAATFVETALWVDRSEHADPVGQMYDAFVRILEQRTSTRRVEVVRGDIDQTLARFERALDNGDQ